MASTSGGAAAAVAPAPTPIVAPRPQSSVAKLVLFLALLSICLVGAKVYLDSQASQRFAAQHPTPLPPQQHKGSMPNGAFTVNAQGAHNYRFTVPAGALNVTLKGHFAATGGGGNDIEVFVVTEDEYVNWQNGHPTKAFYNSGKVTQDSFNLALPADAATYYVVFNNKFSLITPKAVEANVDVNFYTR